jgi:signal peptidase II
VFLGALGAVLIADQLTKAVVGRLLAPGQVLPARGLGARSPVRLRHVAHDRLAAGRIVIVVSLVPMIAGTGLIAASRLGTAGLVQIGLGLAVGGAIGNAIDLLRGRPVIDFVDLRVWPVFNLADAAITCGIVLTLWGLR